MSEQAGESELRLGFGLVQRVVTLSLAALGAAMAISLAIHSRVAVSLGVGGGILISFLWLHLQLARGWAAAPRRRPAVCYAAALWLVKWPLAGAVLWLAIARGLAYPIWICVGTTIVPAAIAAAAIRPVSIDHPERRGARGK